MQGRRQPVFRHQPDDQIGQSIGTASGEVGRRADEMECEVGLFGNARRKDRLKRRCGTRPAFDESGFASRIDRYLRLARESIRRRDCNGCRRY